MAARPRFVLRLAGAALVVLACSLPLAACGGGGDAPSTGAPVTTPSPISDARDVAADAEARQRELEQQTGS